MTRPIKSFSSLTLDNDIAFRRHGELSCILKAPVYFCHAYHSWEKWGVEFSNRLIREYIPKGSDISQIPEEYILDLEVRLNNRPRKILQYKTPLEVMQENEQFHTFADYPCTTKAWGI
jgi:IS30 family transposase